MHNPHISFVILHYMTAKYTINCVNSIIDKIDYTNYSIVIVDNCSPNDSYQVLTKTFSNTSNIYLLQSKANLGFAKGNNIGYRYAKEVLNAQYIIAVNNDTTITQPSFIEEIINLYSKHNYYILGPDIISADNCHQNPYRNHIISLKEAKKWYFNRFLWTCFLKLDKHLNLSKYFSFFRKMYQHRTSKNNAVLQHLELQEDVVLQGACIIFSPAFITKMDYAFYPETYMYCEEDILSQICKKNDWKILFSPSLRIHHAECASTNSVYSTQIDKEIFQSANIVKSLRILIKIIKGAIT